MTNDPNINSFFVVFRNSLLVALGIIILMLACSSCSFFNKSQSSRKQTGSDSSNVKKVTETLTKVDTSKTKSESTYTKETIYFGRDTTINNYFTTPAPTVIVRETGTKKEETQNFNFENYRKDLIDSIRIAHLELELSKKSETKVKVLDFWQILALGMVGLIVLYFVANKFITLKK
jgi:hypothetical protein